ncbi:MAG: helix-turn-helix transcriptional regulator, partial [Marinobacter sp.]
MNLGSAIEQCRTLKGLTKSKLAALAGLSISYVTLIEQGERDPTMASIEKISNALGLPPSLLILMATEDDELTSISEGLKDELKKITSE